MIWKRQILIWALIAISILSGSLAYALQNDEVSFPFEGIKRTHRTTTIPRPLNINILEIDLSNPAISFLVTPGGPECDDPDTDIQEEVLSRRTTTFVADYGVQVGINGAFSEPAEEPHYEYQPRAVLGLAVSDGLQYSTDDGMPALTFPQFPQSGTAYIGWAQFPTDVYNAVGGNKMLVENGEPVDASTWDPIGGALEKHPRTSSGLSADGKTLIIIVVDGRQTGFSEGVTLPEMEEYLIEFGAYNGVNHDGGGSSTMVFEGIDGNPTIINYPSDAAGERIVSNHLGIFSDFLYGDINNNGRITAYDASLAIQHVVGLINLSPKQQKAADVTGDGTITALDAALILQYAVGLITQFPKMKPLCSYFQQGASILTVKDEKQLLTKIITELENISSDSRNGFAHLTTEQKRVLEQLENLIWRQLIPGHITLLQNYPNPFNLETWIPFQLAQETSVTIQIYNVKGQLIRTITLGNKKAGIYMTKDKAAYWDGKDSLGEKVSSGVYLYILQAGKFKATRKMIIVK
jgi:hypothetical protein